MNAATRGRHHRDPMTEQMADWIWRRIILPGPSRRHAHREGPGRWTFSDWQQVTR